MGLTCIVTVHGIGFQQPPDDTASPPRPGYADGLHESLRECLGARLGDDPERGGHGPVYVQSSWKGVPRDGLERLAHPLVSSGDGVEVAHIALVYSELEIPAGPRIGSALDTAARAVLNLDQYAHPLSAIRMILADAVANLHPPSGPRTAGPTEAPAANGIALTPRAYDRKDLAAQDEPVRTMLSRSARGAGPVEQDGAIGIVAALEQDVASYVCRNDLRTQVRCFVADALAALSAREDVDAIVLNTHSQGTVVVFDLLADTANASASPQDPASKVRGLLTAGSPLRKYVEMFAWGVRAGHLAQMAETGGHWINVWDPFDPVADPLRGDLAWRRGDPPPSATDPTLFRITPDDVNLDDGGSDCPVTDLRADNLGQSTGGLRAHNYWGNPAFAPILAGLVDQNR